MEQAQAPIIIGCDHAAVEMKDKIKAFLRSRNTGLGMSMVANRFSGVRAALCNDLFSAAMARRHNDANVLVLGGRVLGDVLALEIVRTWLETGFEGDRHQRRLDLFHRREDMTGGH